MRKEHIVQAVFVAPLLLTMCFPPMSTAENVPSTPSREVIHVDIPVTFEKANVVFVMNHLEFAGDMPVGIRYMHMLAKRYREKHITGRIIGLFFGDAAHMTLDDRAYNAYRSVSSGNPYKELISALIDQGVQVEECAVSMKHHTWSNEDLLPGVKVTTGAVIRLVQLTQQGYVQIQP
ncbi:MAG: DsrE family protein [Nitrospirota bacterium]